MSDSIGGLSRPADWVRSRDDRGMQIYSREENAARWEQAEANAEARKKNPSLRELDQPPEVRATNARLEAAFLQIRGSKAAQSMERQGLSEGNQAVQVYANPVAIAGLTGLRAAELKNLAPGGLADEIRRTVSDKAADSYIQSTKEAVHNAERKLGWKLTDFSTLDQASESASSPINIHV